MRRHVVALPSRLISWQHGRISLITLFLAALLLASCGGSIPRPLSKSDQRIFRFTENTIVQSSILRNRQLASNVTESLGSRWRYWLHGQRPMSMVVELHPDTVNLGGNTITQAENSGSFLARIILRDIETDTIVTDFVHRTVLDKRTSSFLPSDDQAALDRALASQFVDELFAMFYYGDIVPF